MIFLGKRQDNMDGDLKWMGILLVDSAPSVLIPLYLVFLFLGFGRSFVYYTRYVAPGYVLSSKALQAIASSLIDRK